MRPLARLRILSKLLIMMNDPFWATGLLWHSLLIIVSLAWIH